MIIFPLGANGIGPSVVRNTIYAESAMVNATLDELEASGTITTAAERQLLLDVVAVLTGRCDVVSFMST